MDYRTILSKISEAVLTVDAQLRIQIFNSAAEKLTGYSADEVKVRNCSEIFGSELCEELAKALDSSESVLEYESAIIRKDEVIIPVRISVNVTRSGDGKAEYAVCSLRDVTEIRNLTWEVVEKHTMALEETARLETILNSIAEGVFTIDNEWRIDSFNAAAERITGFTLEESIGRYCHEVFRSDMCGRNCPVAQSLETGRPVSNYEVNITRKDGRTVPISVSASVLMNDDGIVVGAVESFRDISEIKRLAAEVHDKYEFRNIIGKSRDMQRIFDLIQDLRDSSATVLVQGESGTGKELIARAIHYSSSRKDKPFVAVSCAALAESILESELINFQTLIPM